MTTRSTTFALAAAATTLTPVGTVHADFIGPTVVDAGNPNPGATTYRVYVNYDDPADQQLAVSGNNDVSPLIFWTNTVLINDGGAFAGLKSEDFAGFPLTGAYDTWVTIGASTFAGNATDYSPGFLNTDGIFRVIEGSSWSDTNDGWYDANPGIPINGGSILIAQFTVADAPNGSPGVFSLQGTTDYNLGGSTLTSEAFAVAVPAPGAVALLALGGLGRAQRRRRR